MRIRTESLIVLRSRLLSRMWCPVCAAEVEVVAAPSLRFDSLIPGDVLEAWLQHSDLHQLQGKDGSELICLHSLMARIQNPTTGGFPPSRDPQKEEK
jgi:hypothetical protein